MRPDVPARHQLTRLLLLATAVAVLPQLACFNNAYKGMDLWRPPFHCVDNQAALPMTVLAEGKFPSERLGQRPGSTIYRMLDVRRVDPGDRSCFRWPWTSREGRINTVTGADTTFGEWFDPWAAEQE